MTLRWLLLYHNYIGRGKPVTVFLQQVVNPVTVHLGVIELALLSTNLPVLQLSEIYSFSSNDLLQHYMLIHFNQHQSHVDNTWIHTQHQHLCVHLPFSLQMGAVCVELDIQFSLLHTITDMLNFYVSLAYGGIFCMLAVAVFIFKHNQDTEEVIDKTDRHDVKDDLVKDVAASMRVITSIPALD